MTAGHRNDTSLSATLLRATCALMVIASILVAMMLWNDTLTQSWRSYQGGSEHIITNRSILHVWSQWHNHALFGWIGQAELTLILTFIIGTPAIFFLAWLNLPLIHRAGSIWTSYKRSLRTVVIFFWPLAAATLACGTIIVAINHNSVREPSYTLFGPGPLRFVATMCFTCGLIICLRILTRRAQPNYSGQHLPPRCEGCGYDLTHIPTSGRCTECGLEITASLDQPGSRPGNPWEHRRSAAIWLATIRAVIFKPTAFYRQLKLRSPDCADTRLATWNFVLLPCAGFIIGACTTIVAYTGVSLSTREYALAILALLFFSILAFRAGRRKTAALIATGLVLTLGFATIAPGWQIFVHSLRWLFLEVAVILPTMMLYAVCACWAAHRIISSLVASWWLIKRELPDFAWAARVIAYETSYLWVFVCFWSVLAITFAISDTWITELLGFSGYHPILLGFPAEPLILMLGTLLLALLWFRRYTIAYRAIRWSNY